MRLTLARTPLPARLEGGKLGKKAGKVSFQVSPEIGECGERWCSGKSEAR